MTILKTFGQGMSTANKKSKMVIYLWLVNFVFSILILTPVYFLLQKDLSRSLLGEQIGKGFDLIWMGDLIYKYRNILPTLAGWFLIPSILFFMLYIYLNGGIIGRLAAQGEKTNLSTFFADCGKYFFRFFRVFLISILGYAVFFGIVLRIFSLPLDYWRKNASTEWPLILSSSIRFLVIVLLFSVIRMFFDYVRIRLVVENSKKTIKATLVNFSFIGKHFLKAWLLYLLVGLVVVIFALVYMAVYQAFPKIGVLIIAGFLWQQIYIISRAWTKILFLATEYHFYKAHKPKELEIPQPKKSSNQDEWLSENEI